MKTGKAACRNPVERNKPDRWLAEKCIIPNQWPPLHILSHQCATNWEIFPKTIIAVINGNSSTILIFPFIIMDLIVFRKTNYLQESNPFQGQLFPPI